MKPLAAFTYRLANQIATVEIFTLPSGDAALSCPVCSSRYKLPAPKFPVTLDTTGRPTIGARVQCPNPHCGWLVAVLSGVAYDFSDNPATTAHAFSKPASKCRHRCSWWCGGLARKEKGGRVRGSRPRRLGAASDRRA